MMQIWSTKRSYSTEADSWVLGENVEEATLADSWVLGENAEEATLADSWVLGENVEEATLAQCNPTYHLNLLERRGCSVHKTRFDVLI